MQINYIWKDDSSYNREACQIFPAEKDIKIWLEDWISILDESKVAFNFYFNGCYLIVCHLYHCVQKVENNERHAHLGKYSGDNY